MTKTAERITILVLSLIVGILVALQLKSVTNATRRASIDGLQMQEVREQLNVMVEKNEALNARNRELENLLYRLDTASEASDERIRYYLDEVKRHQTFAGLNDVRGPGGIIQIAVTGEKPVTSAELLVILNELKASGVEAISINGQRVVAMTEIRSLGSDGSDIQMNGERISDENGFEIRVIGETNKIKSAMDFLTETVARMRIDGKNVTVSYPDSVEIPGLSESSPAYRQGMAEVIEPES